jgi:hypothetical protein
MNKNFIIPLILFFFIVSEPVVMSIKTLDVDTLKDTMDTISAVQCAYYSEACSVAMENQSKTTGVNLPVTGDTTTSFNLNWTSPTNLNGWQEEKKFTENGAVGLSFMLSLELTEYKVVEEALIGTGVDYWLAYDKTHPKYDALNFMSARLEISGILAETKTNSFDKRIKEKKAQTKPSDGTGLPAYVSVIEFSGPKAYFAKK